MYDTTVFADVESNVRSYCRTWPAVFAKAKGSLLYTETGERYIDFFSGAGALNYGHNHDSFKEKLIAYLSSDAIVHGLDCHTVAKRDFLRRFRTVILDPRGLDYKCQFSGPTGTNAVEAALKLARKVKGRPGVFAFTGGFHGMSLGSLAATGNKMHRGAAGVPLSGITFMPYPHGFMQTFDTIAYMDAVLNDPNSGIEKPAAIIFETVQGEGGVVVASIEWMQRLKGLCEKHDILLICDDIQVGCGRTGTFFSFERAGIVPDIVVLSKSLSGYGLPLSMVLLKPELDIWKPGEHNGTFRGNQPAFVTGAAALDFWIGGHMEGEIKKREAYLRDFMRNEIGPVDARLKTRGLGCIWGIDLAELGQEDLANRVVKRCFDLGVTIETAGRRDSVIKLLPALNIDSDLLAEGCAVLKRALVETLSERDTTQNGVGQYPRELSVTNYE